MEKQQFIEKATEKIKSTIYEPFETIDKIQFTEQDVYEHYWITITCKRSVFVDEIKQLSDYFKDPLISIYAINDNLKISIYARIN